MDKDTRMDFNPNMSELLKSSITLGFACKLFHQHTIKIPKSQRFVIAKMIEDAVLNFYDLLALVKNVF
jgi:hypothetical protein